MQVKVTCSDNVKNKILKGAIPKSYPRLRAMDSVGQRKQTKVALDGSNLGASEDENIYGKTHLFREKHEFCYRHEFEWKWHT